jgi:hypothetical protein
MISSGMALMAAERMVIANPAWIHTMTTIRKKVLHGGNIAGTVASRTEPDEELVGEADLGPTVGLYS